MCIMLFLSWTSIQMFLHTAAQPYVHVSVPGLDGKAIWVEALKVTITIV